MKVRPSKMHYCAQCDDNMEGEIREDGTPTLRIGCCFDLEWSGDREDAESLYDYLESAGYINKERRCKDGCHIPEDDTESYDYTGWKCGVCGERYDEDDSYWNEDAGEYIPGREAAIACCKDREEVSI